MRHDNRRQKGFALIAVMAALAILLTLVTAFLAGVFNEADSSSKVVAQAATDHRNQGQRDLILQIVSRTDMAEDTTPFSDAKEEFPQRLDIPAAFQAKGPRKYSSISSGEVWDLQGKININTASPMLVANLLGLSASLKEEVPPDGDTLAVDEGSSFPERNGDLLVDGEWIEYERRDGNTFTGLTRHQLDHTLPEDTLVLDYRCVVLATRMYDPTGDGPRNSLTPYSDVHQANLVSERSNVSPFTEAEMDLLLKHCTTDSGIELSSRWGKPQRVFTNLDSQSPVVPVLHVKSALGFGAGTLVRIRSLENDNTEYGLVTKTTVWQRRGSDINLPAGSWQLVLLRPVRNDYKSTHTVVEPLVPHPININTAEPEVLVATLRNLRLAPRVPPPVNDTRGGKGTVKSRYGPKIGLQYAKEIANRILQLRGGRAGTEEGSDLVGPFHGWEDLCKRLLTPLGQEAANFDGKRLVLLMLQNWLTGRNANAEMTTAPISFTSASLVEYRVATMVNKFSLDENARRERHGIAFVAPPKSLDLAILTQDSWEELFRLPRGCPGYITYPINVAPLHPGALGDDPADHVAAYLYAALWPDSGLGEPRYPNRELADVGVRQVPAVVRPEYGDNWASHESFRLARHPEGRDVTKEGHYEMLNKGPTGPGAGPQQRRGRHDQKTFHFTGAQGMPRRYGIHVWWHGRASGNQSIFEAAAELRERNLISLRLEEQEFVLEVLDEAGLDPDVRATRTQVERTAGQIRVPLADLNYKDNTPVHFNFAADGNRPGQMSMMVDGVPRRGTRFMTRLTREIPVWEQPQGAPPFDDGNKAHYIEIHVDDTEHFPEQGVLRIGREIFEYTSKDKSTFYCKDSDSMGGRKARLEWYELRKELDKEFVDNRGRINRSQNRITRTEQEQAPAHPEGAAVELYGYSAPLYRNTLITVGEASLVDRVGAFAVARGFLKNPDNISIPLPNGGSLEVGRGLLDTNVEDLELANPVPDQEGKGYPPDKAENRIFEAFPESGGFALLVQRGFRVNPTEMGGAPIVVGGAEVISYGRRKENVLSGIKRGVTFPNIKVDQEDRTFDGKAHIFVADWSPNILDGVGKDATPVRELAGYVLYVVPISLPVRGSLTDPTVLGLTEWAQIYPKGEEHETEWVRYDLISDGHIVRFRPLAYTRLHRHITGQTNRGQIDLGRGGGTVQNGAAEPAYDPPHPSLVDIKRIGFAERIENEHPVIYQARLVLQFRGDPITQTSSHAHDAGTMVLPTHRLQLDAGIYGGLSARAGRNDRVAFVGGTQAHGGNRPPVEWHTVNWAWQRHGFDVEPDQDENQNQNSTPDERLGDTPCQIVGLKAGVRQAYVGAANPDDFRDIRQVDRVVKFPSGELPAAYVDHAKFGGSAEYAATDGIVDELMAVLRESEPMVLVEDINKEAQQFTVHQNLRLFPWGTITVPEDVTQKTPNYGGLVMIDGEIIAFQSHAGGAFQVAENGRGLLGTEPRAHGRGARVHFLRHLPAAILAAGLSENSHQLVFNNLGNLPRYGGTLLLGNELLHYTWTVANTMAEMPVWREPADDEQSERAEKGLFRGRYGTVPRSAAGGEVAIYFPTRYWDRFHERADDPEMAYAQVTLDQHDVFYDTIRWTEENPDQQLLDLRCYVRVDGLAPFDADPEKERMLFLFKEGTVNDKANVLHRQGSVLGARFMTEYRPGAFDPENYLMHAWKLTPTLRDCVIEYEGETHILKERVVQR